MGMKRLTGETELPEYTVHDECDTGHVAAILKDGQEQEQNQHLGNEAQNCANAADDAVNYQAAEPVSSAELFHEPGSAALKPLCTEDIVGPVGQEGAEGAHGNPVNEPHDNCEDGQCSDTVGNDLIDLIGGGELSPCPSSCSNP